MINLAIGIVVLAFGVVACAALPPSTTAGPADPAAEMRPDLLVAPPAAAAGDIVPLMFPESTMRGVHFVLERRAGDSWNLVYHLISDANDGQPSAFRPNAEGMGIPDVGIGGPGPDRVLIPEDVDSGAYRVCTGNAGQNFCAPIEVRAR